MKKVARRFFTLTFVLLLGTLLFTPFLRMGLSASTLGETYLFLGRMQVETETEMILLFTPSTDFEDGEEDRVLRIYFPEDENADWCLDEGEFTTVSGLGSEESPIDTGDWSIEESLPGDLTATCHQGGAGERDYIEVTGITTLTEGTSYGVEFGSQGNLFKTGPNHGGNLVTVQLSEGLKIESITFEINLTATEEDQLIVTAEVDSAETILCTIGSSTVSMGTLYRGGAYVTAHHSLSTNSGTGFYWSVYGEGDGTTPGLQSDVDGSVLSSLGDGNVVDLIGGQGFGLVVSSYANAEVSPNYLPDNLGQFGAIDRGFEGSRLLLTSEAGEKSYQITLGARAGVNATEGLYSETLTYICGGYVGEYSEDCSTVAVGEPCGGGIVAYHDGNGGGLIAAASDQSDGVQWGCRGTLVGTSTDYDTGSSNTDAIIAFHEGWEDPWETGPDGETCHENNNGEVAARIAREYDGGGYDDWFLPSIDEMEAMYNAGFDTGNTSYYWSSSEGGSVSSWRQRFSDGNQFYFPKINTHRVRAVRAF